MLLSGQTLGKYRVVSPLGSGSFGAVYLARDTWIDRQVALKVPHQQDLNFADLLREPRLLAALDHPNIVSITTADKQDGIFFIVMEYVEGETLETLLGGGTLPADQAVDYALQAGHAIRHAHEQGVVHRDLRPPNMLISKTGVLKVADFGVSRLMELAGNRADVIGSPPYMAPEQMDGRAAYASDVYSLGVTLYQMLAGGLPYDAATPAAVQQQMRDSPAPTPHACNPSVPAALGDVVMQAMAPELLDRYQSAQQLLDALHRVGSSPPAPEPPAPPVAAEPATSAPPEPLPPEPPALGTTSPSAPFCWHCHKPLHARAGRCPFCGERQ